MKLDKETQEAMARGERLAALVAHDGWSIAKDLLNEKMALLDSWTSLPDSFTDTEKLAEMKARHGAISFVQTWINEIEARTQNTQSLADLMREQKPKLINYLP